MGYSLLGAKSELSLNESTYREVLRLANLHGWKPQGTLQPVAPPESWMGSEPRYLPAKPGVGYFGNDGQIVTDEDAIEIALALDRWLATPEAQCDETQPFSEVVTAFSCFCKESGFDIF
jgi:hypothetical protein